MIYMVTKFSLFSGSFSDKISSIPDLSLSVFDNSRTLYVVELLTDTDQTLKDITEALVNLNAGIISPQILPPSELSVAIPALENKISTHGFTLETTSPMKVYNLPFSFAIQDGILDLLVHFHGYNPLSGFDLWQWIDLPFFVGNEIVKVEDTAKFIAVENQFDRVIVPQDMTKCPKLKVAESSFICPHAPIMKKSNGICLADLFRENKVDSCKLVPTKNVTDWFSSVKETFYVFFSQPTRVHKSCSKKHSFNEKIYPSGIHVLDNTDECSLHTDQFFLHAKPHLANHSIVLHNVTFSLKEVFEAKSRQNFSTPAPEIELLDYAIHSPSLEIFQWILTVIILIIIVSVVSFLSYLYFVTTPMKTSLVEGPV